MKISVVVPVYNAEKYLKQCIESVLNQDYKDFQVILIDDGSKDCSGKICDDYAAKDSRVVVKHIENQGVAVAWDKGLELCRGEYTIGLDSDDFWDRDLLSRCVDIIEKYSCDAVVFGYSNYYPDGRSVPNALGVHSGVYRGYERKLILDKLINQGCFEHRSALYLSRINKLIKTEIVRKNRRYCKKGFYYGEDNLYAIPNILDSETIFVESQWFPYKYRINQTSLTHSYHENLWPQFVELNKWTETILVEKGYRSLVWQVYADSVFHCAIAINNLIAGKKGRNDTVKEIKKILEYDSVRTGLDYMKPSLLSLKEKIYIFLMKHKMSGIIYFLKKLTR